MPTLTKLRKITIEIPHTEMEPYEPDPITHPVDRNYLIELYWDQHLSISEIAKKLRRGKTTIRRYMEEMKIPRRNYREAAFVQFEKQREREAWGHSYGQSISSKRSH